MKHIVVVGLMGVGKTTTASALASHLGLELLDSDRDVQARTGRTGGQIAAEDGVKVLHTLEAQVLLEALAAEDRSVITAAGSTIESADCRAALEARGIVVWLQLSSGEIVRRMASGSHRRSMSTDELERLVVRRTPLFAAAADLIVDASQPTDEIVRTIIGFVATAT
jgi:shikimate kinase